MTYPDDLVEKVARAITVAERLDPDWDGHGKYAPQWTLNIEKALAVLAVISASGTHWIAPWEATEEIEIAAADYGRDYHERVSMDATEMWAAARDAYLAKEGK